MKSFSNNNNNRFQCPSVTSDAIANVICYYHVLKICKMRANDYSALSFIVKCMTIEID